MSLLERVRTWPARRRWLALASAAAFVIVALPLVRIFTFGTTRHARQADCAVVFGARVYDNGQPSLALADRVDEGVRVYRAGLVHKIVMSGAIDRKNGRSEPAVMRARAMNAGVPAEDIVIDEAGVDTRASVENAAAFMRQNGLSSALLVSHYYHEPRIKLLFDRTGLEAYTMPAHMTRRLLKEPYFVAREVAAYYAALLG